MYLWTRCVFAGLFGLVLGCFLNTLEYRIRSGTKIVTKECGCPHCGAVIPLRDQIPVIGYLLLGGKCRSCGAPIGLHYPCVEAGVTVFYVLAALLTAPGVVNMVVLCWIGLVCILLFRLYQEHALRLKAALVRGILLLAVCQLPVGVGMWIIGLA